MDLHALHTERRRLLNEVRGAEMSKQYELAAYLLGEFQKINHRVRDIEELDYHPQDIRHDMAMQII
jgi:hypothetical protein